MADPLTFDQHLVEHAASSPAATALIDDAGTWSYGDVHTRVALVAGGLAARGVQAGTRVLLVADNSAHHLMTAFAVWRAGATLVTVYPSSTAAELQYALAHSQPQLVITSTRLRPAVEAAAAGVGAPAPLEMGDDGTIGGVAAGVAAIEIGRIVEPGSPALICYTSGSTSQPKAVVHSHTGVVAAARSYARVWHLGSRERTLVSMPLAWAFGLVTTSMATLTAGGSVLLVPRSDPIDLLSRFVRHQVTFFAGVTTMFVKMVGAMEHDGAPRPTSLRLCISGGEPRNEHAFARWRELTGTPVHDVYAASECFPVVTYDPVRDPEPRRGFAGRVVDGATLRIVAGEAWVRGPALMLGYWNDPATTAAVLTEDGWYRTGDLVEIDDGYVRVLGRLNDVIIRGGANVSPAEVETVLVAHPQVREAAVVGVADSVYGQEVVAAVVADGAPPELDDLRAHCAVSLAAYKCPTRYVVVDQLPRNANTGKVQRREVAAQLEKELAR